MPTRRLSDLNPEDLGVEERREKVADLITQGDNILAALEGWATDARQFLDQMNADLEDLGLGEEDVAVVATLTSANELVTIGRRIEDTAAAMNGSRTEGTN